MPRLRRGVELSEHELALLARELTIDERYALIDAGWDDDLAAAVDFAVRHSAEAREAWEARREARLEWVPRGAEGGHEQFLVLQFWDRAVPVLAENPRDDLSREGAHPGRPGAGTPRPAGGSTSNARRRRRKQVTYGKPPATYPRAAVADAVRRWREGGEKRNVAEIARLAKLSRPLIERIGRLDDHGAFELGPRGGLWVLGTDRKFRAAAASVSIRSLEMALGLD